MSNISQESGFVKSAKVIQFPATPTTRRKTCAAAASPEQQIAAAKYAERMNYLRYMEGRMLEALEGYRLEICAMTSQTQTRLHS